MSFEAMPAPTAVNGTTAHATAGTGTLTSTGTSYTLTSGGGAIIAGAIRLGPVPGAPLLIAVDDECLIVNDVQDDVLKITRGACGTTAAAHAASAKIYVLSFSALYATLKAAVLAAAPGS